MSEPGVRRTARGHRLVHDYPTHLVFRAGAVIGVDAGFAPGAKALADGGPVVPVGVCPDVQDLRVIVGLGVACARSNGLGGGGTTWTGENIGCWGGLGGVVAGEEKDEEKGKERCQHYGCEELIEVSWEGTNEVGSTR